MRLPTFLRGAVLLAVLAATACRTPRPPDPPGVPASVEDHYLGEIVKVQPELRYVVVQCPRLPKAGRTATVWRDGKSVAVIRFDGPSRAPFHTADIEQGQPRDGDEVTQP
jgi:hypothetical protein